MGRGDMGRRWTQKGLDRHPGPRRTNADRQTDMPEWVQTPLGECKMRCSDEIYQFLAPGQTHTNKAKKTYTTLIRGLQSIKIIITGKKAKHHSS